MHSRLRLVTFLLGLSLVFTFGCSRSATPGAGFAPVVPVQVAIARQADVPRRIESIGTVQALRTVSVKSQVDGIIAQVHFREGGNISAGDLLVTLDRRPFENSLRIARADLVNAQAEASRAQSDAERYTRLDQQDAVSKEQYAILTTKAETTRALMQAKEAVAANAELQLGYTQIRSPIAGRTGQLLLHEGALVKANDNNFPLVTVNQLAPVAVAYAVPEGALEEIRRAFAAGTVTVSALDRTTGLTRENGRLDFIDNAVDVTTGMITLKAVFSNEDQALWPGRFIYTITQVGMDVGAIVVPSTAVQNSQNGSTVYVLLPNQTVALRPVKVLRVAGENTLLAEGITAGETVIVDGQIRLLPGMKAEARTLAGRPVNAVKTP